MHFLFTKIHNKIFKINDLQYQQYRESKSLIKPQRNELSQKLRCGLSGLSI